MLSEKSNQGLEMDVRSVLLVALMLSPLLLVNGVQASPVAATTEGTLRALASPTDWGTAGLADDRGTSVATMVQTCRSGGVQRMPRRLLDEAFAQSPSIGIKLRQRQIIF